MKTRLKLPISFLLVLSAFGTFFGLGRGSFDGENFVRVSELTEHAYRMPSSLKKGLLQKSLSDNLLFSTSPLRSLTQAKLLSSTNNYQLILGHFATMDHRGNSVFACQIYDKVIVLFESLKDSSEGLETEAQQLFFELPCKMEDSDIKHLKALTINPASLLQQPIGEGTVYGDDNETQVSYRNVEDQWARQWQLKTVRFVNSHQKSQNLEISMLDIPPENRPSMGMDWNRFHK